MNTELLNEARTIINTQSLSIVEFNESESINLLDEIAGIFVSNRSKIWWWEGLKRVSSLVPYGSGTSWPIIAESVPDGGSIVYFVITDDDPEPWIVFKGDLKDVGVLISELWRFEYFIANEELNWIVFDTHHNEIVFSENI